MSRVRLPRVEDFPTRLRGPETASRVGIWLGLAFGICFVTGVWSHLQQDTPSWLSIPPSPAGLYRVTQGLHVISGTAAIPLLLVKLWSVYPRLFLRPPRRIDKALAVHLLERASIAVLVAAAIFQVVSGAINIVQWYPWEFSFRRTHGAVAWVAIGALVVHIGVKLPVIVDALRRPTESAPDEPADPAESHLERRTMLRAAMGASVLAVVLTAGQSVPWLRHVSVLAVRRGTGPQGLPINRTAKEAGVVEEAMAEWALELSFAGQTRKLTRDELERLPQVTHTLPIACVEGWSASADWTGVPVRELIALVGASPHSGVTVSSLQQRGSFASSELPPQFVEDGRTLLALRLNGEVLSADHGYPARIIAPNRPGVLQTKWVTALEVIR